MTGSRLEACGNKRLRVLLRLDVRVRTIRLRKVPQLRGEGTT